MRFEQRSSRNLGGSGSETLKSNKIGFLIRVFDPVGVHILYETSSTRLWQLLYCLWTVHDSDDPVHDVLLHLAAARGSHAVRPRRAGTNLQWWAVSPV